MKTDLFMKQQSAFFRKSGRIAQLIFSIKFCQDEVKEIELKKVGSTFYFPKDCRKFCRI